MDKNQKQQVTDIVNAFRLINKDIRECFDIMSEKLESTKNFKKWKKNEAGVKQAKLDYWDAEGLFYGWDNAYYLNCYGLYNEKVVGFTFVVSIDYDEKDYENYAVLLEQLDVNINKNTPMLCIAGIYEPISTKNIKLTDENGWHYVDGILQLTGNWKNYEINKIQYNEWIDVEIEYLEDGKMIKGYEGWYKRAKVEIKNITDISSKEEALEIIVDLIKCEMQSKTDIK
ncbi:hypothetical protein [Candidatus Sulfurimonas baltica]|uniref:Uncharacterized protein n=1 Tax=Candidatus Sulfurimonas baltica TaxID=2740404 RepID=A0A7S7RP20_9BACT|nr:hypothetical protein [Candidatus Sulfurimonas baltica]QOY53025.1 hypothetical protein HUE88_04910 [Candidatus Sulfurimonas baltica]